MAPKTTMALPTSCPAPSVTSAMIRPVDRDTVVVYETRAAEWRDRRPARFVEQRPRARRRGHAGWRATRPRVRARATPPVTGSSRRRARRCLRDGRARPRDLPGRVAAASRPHGAAAPPPVRGRRLGAGELSAHHPPVAALGARRAARGAGGRRARVTLTMRHSDDDGTLPDDDFAGRYFVGWRAEPLADVLVGAGFTVDELVARTGRRGMAPGPRDPSPDARPTGSAPTSPCCSSG